MLNKILGCRQVVRPRVLVSLFEGSNPSALVKVSLIESLGGEMVNTIDSKSITYYRFGGSTPLQGISR